MCYLILNWLDTAHNFGCISGLLQQKMKNTALHLFCFSQSANSLNNNLGAIMHSLLLFS